jgi:hypothetical protein
MVVTSVGNLFPRSSFSLVRIENIHAKIDL